MKNIKLLLFIILAAAVVCAQDHSKADKKTAKEQSKQAEIARKNMTVDFVQLTKFPSSYLGGARRLYRIGLGDVQQYRDSGVTYYLLGLTNGSDSSNMVLLPEEVVFGMDEALARSYVTQMETIKRTDVYSRNRTVTGDVYFELFEKDNAGRRYFAAKISCVAFVTGFNSTITSHVGDCPQVK